MKKYITTILRLDHTLGCDTIYADTPKDAAEIFLDCEVYKLCSEDTFNVMLLEPYKLLNHDINLAEIAVEQDTTRRHRVHYYKIKEQENK